MPPVWYYIPDGVKAPAHLRPGMTPSRVLDGKGPDGKQGLVLGGPFDEATKGAYRRTKAGWWVRVASFDQPAIDSLLRLRGEPFIEPTHDGRRWRIARLLDRDLTIQPHLVTTFGTLNDDGEPVLGEHVRHEALCRRVFDYFRGIRLDESSIEANNLAVMRLACEVLAMWYHLGEYELFAAGAMTWSLADLVLSSCCDFAVDPARLVREPREA